MKKTLILLGLFLLSSALVDTALLAAPGTYTPKVKNIRIRQTTETGAGSYKIVVIVKHDDADEVANVDVQLTPAIPTEPVPSPGPLTLSYDAANSVKNKKRYVNNTLTFASNALGSSYNVTITMKDINGNTVGEVETQTVTVEAGDPPLITGVRIAESNSGYEVMAFVTDAENEVAAVQAQVIPVTMGAPAPNRPNLTLSFDALLPDNTKRFANYGGLIFPASALGYQYAVSLTPLDINGNPLAAPMVISTIVVN